MSPKIKRRLRNREGGIGLLVPGQGFQRLGMGNEKGELIPFLQSVIEQASGIVDPIQVERVRYLMSLDPDSVSLAEKNTLGTEINRTDNAQLALFLVTAALWQQYQENEDNPPPSVVLGHSAGETGAAFIAGALDFPNALKYAVSRGRYMDIANILFPGGMILVGPPKEKSEIDIKRLEACLKGTKVEIANINSPVQIMLSGRLEKIEWIIPRLRAKGFRANIFRGAAGAYHHSLAMASVKKALEELFSSCLIVAKKPSIPWIHNFSGALEEDEKKIRVHFPAQVVSTVMWRKSIDTALDDLGITEFVELGNGQGLTDLLKHFPAWQKMQIKNQNKKPGG